jgi:hypothetical protein
MLRKKVLILVATTAVQAAATEKLPADVKAYIKGRGVVITCAVNFLIQNTRAG